MICSFIKLRNVLLKNIMGLRRFCNVGVIFCCLLFFYGNKISFSCCCFSCVKVESQKEKEERIRRLKKERENALRNKLFNIFCYHADECVVNINRNVCEIVELPAGPKLSKLNKNLDKYSEKKEIKCGNTALLEQKNKDVLWNGDCFEIKHDRNTYKVNFYVLRDNSGEYEFFVYGDNNLCEKLGIEKGKNVLFYYEDDKMHINNQLGEDKDINKKTTKKVENCLSNKFNCLNCIYINKNNFQIVFYNL